MNLRFKNILLILCLSTTAYAQQTIKPVAVEAGVSFELAKYRHSSISNIQYKLDFNIPAQKANEIVASEQISFNLQSNEQPLQIDFKQSYDHIKSLAVNGKTIVADLREEHIVINQQYLHPGANDITLEFIAGDASLNRNADFLYALFVPDRARTVFPCFDQPDLKARFLLTLTVPEDWKVLANAQKRDSVIKGAQITYHFNNSDQLPTYLFSFTAGKFSDTTRLAGRWRAQFLYRETDTAKIRLSVDSIFKAHGIAISFLVGWTGIPYPFQKVGFVAIPDFQFGGMEHPGEVQYKASGLFLDGGATKDQFIARSNVISHEIAHMWFGDMVTMAWFNDVWMKEVFANFMADKVTEKLMGKETFNLKFLQDHYPAAYAVDRTQGANPIRQQLANLQDAGSLYGNIIYHKAPVMMRQLEQLMGSENFRRGIQEYLKKYAYSNATWDDLIAILSKYSKTDLYSWNKVWVNQPGRPVFDYSIAYRGGQIGKLTITQHPETGEPRIWPQTFSITLVYPNRNQNVTVNMNSETLTLKAAEGLDKPSFILFNSNGMGYGVFPADRAMNDQLFTLNSPLQRASAYINAYENMLSGRNFKPSELLKLFAQGLAAEKNEMNLRVLSGYITNIYWEFISPQERPAYTTLLETATWAAMEKQTAPNNKKIMFGAYQNMYLSDAAGKQIYQIWQHQQAPEGVKLTEDDYTSIALSIALKSDTATTVLQQQRSRITNTDRQERLTFLMPALSPKVADRDTFFYALADRRNRQKEAWVATALIYLNHPLRQNTSIKYLPKSLALVEEIQRTGDVFFPQSWLGAVFSNYQSKEAYKTVTDFLNSHPNYNPKLKDKILQATDNLYRAQKMLK
ncbi:MAG: M1 family aminopeptidase [Bacteroidota bacterium]